MDTPCFKKLSYQLFSGLLLISLLFISLQSLAKSPESSPTASPASSKIQTIPETVKNQICRDLSKDKTSCGTDHKIRYIRSVKQTNDQVVMFFYLQDDKPGYHRGVSIPVKLNTNGQWITGSSFVGEPRRVIRDVRGGLWMHAQFSSSGNTPRLLYSKQGLDWLEIKLPRTKSDKSVTQFENISKLCFQGGTMIISLQSTGSANKQILKSWRSNLSKLHTNQSESQKQAWEEITHKMAKSHPCKDYEAKNNDWLIHDGETLTLLQHDQKHLTIKVMHENKVSATQAKLTRQAKPFAIQVGAYSNHALVDQLVTSIQKQGFLTFTKLIGSTARKDKKIKKIYIGPYHNRETTLAKLTELKNKMRDNKPIQSAFVLEFQ